MSLPAAQHELALSLPQHVVHQEGPCPADQQVQLLNEEQAGGAIHPHATAEYEVLQTREGEEVGGGRRVQGMMGIDDAHKEYDWIIQLRWKCMLKIY